MGAQAPGALCGAFGLSGPPPAALFSSRCFSMVRTFQLRLFSRIIHFMSDICLAMSDVWKNAPSLFSYGLVTSRKFTLQSIVITCFAQSTQRLVNCPLTGKNINTLWMGVAIRVRKCCRRSEISIKKNRSVYAFGA